MSKADKMFEELGYRKQEEYTYCKKFGNIFYHYIDFFENDKSYRKFINKGWNYTVEEHLAIHEKMKELGWI